MLSLNIDPTRRGSTMIKCAGCTLSALLGAIGATIAVVKFAVVALAALAGFAVVAAGLLAYLKREQWTKPAYRWARDTSGRWSMTPWTPAAPGAAGFEPVVEPTPADGAAG
jgi:hypothetical protein